MTPEQLEHCNKNRADFNKKYLRKYRDGQKSHGGNMWQMGACQALENMEAEVLDQWSYCRQIRKCLDEIREVTEREFILNNAQGAMLGIEDIKNILNRVKED